MERLEGLESAPFLQGILGYLNFSEGKPDARFQKQFSDAFRALAERGVLEPWRALVELLRLRIRSLKAAGGAFRDLGQAEAVVNLVFEQVLPAYRRHHRDLLAHLSDRELYQPFFLARVCEAVLAEGGPWDEGERILKGVLRRLNDYVGYRPMAILETRPRGEPYDHERVRPIPLYIRGAGVAWGTYEALLSKTLEILNNTDAALLAEACFDPNLLEELALDPRAYDHGHPVNRRPNYVFGEWDPHLLDNQGRYRRFLLRQVVLDAILDRVEGSRSETAALPKEELLFEGAAVLAGTMLMAAATSGAGPATHDSSTTLATLMPRIARCRDTFYSSLLARLSGPHGNRLRREADLTRQPFGSARQHLNQFLATHRAAQLQERHLALLFADMGYPEASRRHAARIPTASVRILSEIAGRISIGHLLVSQGRLSEAAAQLPEIEDLLRRGIHCGALADPWNILGFQGLFPLFQAREDSVRDTRVDDLVQLVDQIFNLYARILSEAAATGNRPLVAGLQSALNKLAVWWDRFATAEVSEVRRVHGEEAASSAEHLARALGHWHERGVATADLAFWREHLQGFRSPKSFALVVEALLRKQDYRAAMALLLNWLNQAELVPLEEGEHSFHALAQRLMVRLTAEPSPQERWAAVRKFFDYLEANAEDYWQVPSLETAAAAEKPGAATEESLYEAAYEDVTYRDSAADDHDGSLVDDQPQSDSFDLDEEGERLVRRLRFLSTVARLWVLAVRPPGLWEEATARETLASWLKTARANHRQLLGLLDALHEFAIPEPLGNYESLIEFDRRRVLKEQLLYTAINTCLETGLAVGALRGRLGDLDEEGSGPPWEPAALRLEQALLNGDVAGTRSLLGPFLRQFSKEPLLFTALADGGCPRDILRARTAQQLLQALAIGLPRLGLLRETHRLLASARAMELAHPPQGRGVTEFNQLFELGFQGVTQSVIDSALAQRWAERDELLTSCLERLTEPFLKLWIEHSRTLRLSTLEGISSEAEWDNLRQFIRRYGRDLFHARFMTLSNLRAILHRGPGSYLDYLRDNPDPLQPVRLVEDLAAGRIDRAAAVEHMQRILQALVENYEEYKDYNTTTTQSDYGENLYMLLDFLRLKASYERHSWEFRPLVLVHDNLARKGLKSVAIHWEQGFAELTQDLAKEHLDELAEMERTYGLRLRTVADRLGERFVRPLALDRLCALIETAMEEARLGENGPAFRRLQAELQGLAAAPSGVGLDVPHWLRRLEVEVQRIRRQRSGLATTAEDLLQIPRRLLSRQDIETLLQEWAPSAPE